MNIYGDELKQQIQDQRANKLRQFEMSDQERRLNQVDLSAYEQKDFSRMTSKMGVFGDKALSKRNAVNQSFNTLGRKNARRSENLRQSHDPAMHSSQSAIDLGLDRKPAKP